MPPLLRAVRPKQWLKNVLVGAAPLAAGALLTPAVWLPVILAFVTFCIASSGVYLVNDILDVEADRAHPEKKNRPIASGRLSIRTAVIVGVVLLLLAPALAFFFVSDGLGIVLVVYEAIQIAYCLWLKHLVVIDLVVVSSGFLIRAIAGAVAIAVPVSQWFLLVTAFGSLFMVAGKRYSEKLQHIETGAATRRSLVGYSVSYLRFVWTIAATLTLITYALWAFDLGDFRSNIWPAISIVPFGVAILRYGYSVDRGVAGAPEETVLRDRQLLVLGLVWLVSFAIVLVVR